jgi:hypothetical protein
MVKIIKGYKGFNEDLKCRDFQYKIGNTYEIKGKPEICGDGFHFCEFPLDVFGYYEPAQSKFCEVESLGDTDIGDDKIATNKIKIGAELNFKALAEASIKFVYERTKKDNKKSACKKEDRSVASNTGNRSVAINAGDRSVAINAGDRSVASNTGNRSVASNTGYSSVASNTGNRSVAINAGHSSVAINTGYGSVAINTGYGSVAINTGYGSVASNTGDSSVAINTGYGSVASNTGDRGISSSLGIDSKAKGKMGTWLVLAEWICDENYNYEVKQVKTVKIDGKKIKEETLYQLINGKFMEVKDDNN